MPYKNKEIQREYQRKWMAQRRAEYFADKSCVLCGLTNELELDHIDPSKKISHNIWSWSQARRNEELKKCQVLCSTHHLEKTLEQRPDWEHGTASGYAKGCRKSCCRTAASRAKAIWRQR